MRMKQKKKKIFEENNSKWSIFQNGCFSKSPILEISQIGPWVSRIDAKGIDVAQPIWL